MNPLSILHAADLHIGKKYGPGRIDAATGLDLTTVRELATLEEVLDIAIWGPDAAQRAERRATEPDSGAIPDCPERVAVLVLAGDIFNYPGPFAVRILRSFQHQLLRAVRAGIRVVIIPGNHDHPKTRADGSIYSLYEEFNTSLGIHAVYKGVAERVPAEGALGDLVFHCVPHTYSQERMREELALAADAMRADREAEAAAGIRRYHILVTHVQVNTTSIPVYRYGLEESMRVEIADLDQGYDLVLLGDYHKAWQYEGRIFYAPGCRNRFDEADVQPHVNRFTLTPAGPQVQQVPLTTVRPMLDLPVIDCSDESTGALKDVAAINDELRAVTAGCAGWGDHLVRLVIRNAPHGLVETLDHQHLASVRAQTFWFKLDIRYQTGSESGAGVQGDEREPVSQRVLRKLQARTSERVFRLGVQYLQSLYPELGQTAASAAAGSGAESASGAEPAGGAETDAFPAATGTAAGGGDVPAPVADPAPDTNPDAAPAADTGEGSDGADPFAALAFLPDPTQAEKHR